MRLPSLPSRRRTTHLLAGVTAGLAAVAIAAVAAGPDDVPATADRATIDDRPPATTGQGARPEGDAGPSPLAPQSLLPAPLVAAQAPLPPTVGEVERLAQREPLATLPSPADVQVTSVLEEEVVYEAADGELIDADRVHAFLDGREAPLAAHAETLVAAGIEHGVDPRVVVAIAIAESNGGKRLPPGSHNAWGWGGSGPSGLRAWDSWEESIDSYTERLGALYDTDNVDWEFASTYCPPNTRWWYDTVTWAIGAI